MHVTLPPLPDEPVSAIWSKFIDSLSDKHIKFFYSPAEFLDLALADGNIETNALDYLLDEEAVLFTEGYKVNLVEYHSSFTTFIIELRRICLETFKPILNNHKYRRIVLCTNKGQAGLVFRLIQ